MVTDVVAARALAKTARHAASENGDLVRTLVSSRSETEANLALALLRDSVPDSGLVEMTNLRETLAELPAPPFAVSSEIDMLGRVLDWEVGPHSARKAFDSDEGVFGIEVFGEGNRVDRVLLLTVQGSADLHGTEHDLLDPAAVDLLLHYGSIADRLIEALLVLGFAFTPRFYLSVSDYVMENARTAAAELGGMF